MSASSGSVRRITIVDVARHAGVSVTAVSKVLRNADGASPQMRTRVRQAIDELGYRPSTAARALRGTTRTIGVMLPDVRNPFFADVLDGMAARFAASGYDLLTATCCNDVPGEARAVESMIDRNMSGVILIAPLSSREYLAGIASTLPMVVVGRHGQSPGSDSVTNDDFAGAGLVVRHLVGLGHRRIGHIEHLETDPVRLAEMPNARRADGYRHAMAVHGLQKEIAVASTTYTQQGGYLGARELLARRRPPTAIFAGADIVAMGVLDALAEAGMSVPGDVSVAGYDNTTFAAFAAISLTSVDQAGREIGSHSARLLLERIDDRNRPSTQIRLSPELVTRGSTASPGH